MKTDRRIELEARATMRGYKIVDYPRYDEYVRSKDFWTMFLIVLLFVFYIFGYASGAGI